MPFEYYMSNTIPIEVHRDFQWNQVEEYIQGVEDGTIITNKWIKLAFKKFQNDLVKAKLWRLKGMVSSPMTLMS